MQTLKDLDASTQLKRMKQSCCKDSLADSLPKAYRTQVIENLSKVAIASLHSSEDLSKRLEVLGSSYSLPISKRSILSRVEQLSFSIGRL
jgi:hypothetical protein